MTNSTRKFNAKQALMTASELIEVMQEKKSLLEALDSATTKEQKATIEKALEVNATIIRTDDKLYRANNNQHASTAPKKQATKKQAPNIQATRNAEAKQSTFIAASTDASELKQVKELCQKLATTYASTQTEFLIAMIAIDFDKFHTMRKRNDIYASNNEKASFCARRSNETITLTAKHICQIDAQKILHRHYAKRLNLNVDRRNDSIIDVDATDNASSTKKLLQSVRASTKALAIIAEYKSAIYNIHCQK